MSEVVLEVATDRNAVWLQGTPESQREQLVNRARLVGTKRRFIQLYRVPAGTQPWEKPDVDEFIQATGTDGRMTVELFRLEGNEIRAYVVGRGEPADDSVPSESVLSGDNAYTVLPTEVWSPEEMTDLLVQYRDGGGVLATDGLALREQEEFRRVVDHTTNAGNTPAEPSSRASASTSSASDSHVVTGSQAPAETSRTTDTRPEPSP